MIQLTPIAISATSQQYLANVVENLCQAYCLTDSVQPTGSATFTVASQQSSGTQTIVTINAAVIVTYQPKGYCKSVVRQYNEQFQVAFIGAAGSVPTIAIEPLTTVVTADNIKCGNKAYGVSLATPITITVTFPAA